MNVETPSPDQDPPVTRSGFSPGWPEVIVSISVGCVLLFVAWVCLCSPFYSATQRFRLVWQMSNMHYLYLATDQMVRDGVASNIPAYGWPGDTGSSFTNWTAQLVQRGYLTTNDLVGMLSTVGHYSPPDTLPTPGNTGVLIYAVSTNSPARTVFLSTWNFTNSPDGGKLAPGPSRFAFDGFAVLRKEGDGAIYRRGQAGDTNTVGGYAPLCH